jgi:hypothetical protein
MAIIMSAAIVNTARTEGKDVDESSSDMTNMYTIDRSDVKLGRTRKSLIHTLFPLENPFMNCRRATIRLTF